MDIYTFIELAKKYNDLGWAIQEQFDDIVQGEFEDINPNAFLYIESLLLDLAANGVSESSMVLDEAVRECRAGHTKRSSS